MRPLFIRLSNEVIVRAAVRTATGDEGRLEVAVNSAGFDGEIAVPPPNGRAKCSLAPRCGEPRICRAR